jgi:acyl carrier protein
LLNAYGPTETIITATTCDIPADLTMGQKVTRVPIGNPRSNRYLKVTDPHGKPVPPGIAGELLIGGTALAEGYLNQPEQTEKAFITVAETDGTVRRYYRTGDLVRFDRNGNLVFLGRVDQQVKIRGFRIELQEIEKVLSDHPEIQDTIVTVHTAEDGGKHLIAYIIPKAEENVHTEELKAHLAQQLPGYMVPGVFQEMDAWPLSPGGKIDRRKLPVPDTLYSDTETPYVAARTETEKMLSGIIKEVLNIQKVGIRDSFFNLGGHSMQGTQVLSRIRDQFDIDLPLRTIFENPTIEGIARAITEQKAIQAGDSDLDSMLDEIENLSDDELTRLLDEE